MDILVLVPAMTTRKRIQNHKNKYCRKWERSIESVDITILIIIGWE